MDGKVAKKAWRERRSVLYVALIVITVVVLAAVILMVKLKGFYKDDFCITLQCTQASVFFLDIINPRSKPCENFYDFSCGGYTGNSTLEASQQQIDDVLKSIIVSPTNRNDSRSVKLQKKYYQACMDVKSIEEDGNRSLMKVFDKMGGWPLIRNNWNDSSFEWGRIVEICIENGLYYDWFLYVENEPLYNQSNENLHIKPPDNVNKITPDLRESYILLIANVLITLGDKFKLAPLSEDIRRMVNFENEMFEIIEASKRHSKAEMCTVGSLEENYPFMTWSSLFKNVVWANGSRVICNVDGYLDKFGKLLNKTSKRVHANYIFWKLTESVQSFLSHNIRSEFRTFQDLRGASVETSRSEYCYGVTSTVFAYVSEAHYARKFARQRAPVRRIIENIKEVLSNHIDDAPWMNKTHKIYANWKLRNMTFVIGGPEEMYHEEKFERLLGLNEIDILHLNNTFDIIRAVDKSRDGYNLNLRRPKLSIQRIRFYGGVGNLQSIRYLPEGNFMFLPAAAFTDLIYSEHQPEFRNYGALGTIIGHELVHGFGTMDSVEFANGHERINWSNSTFADFYNASECLLSNCNEIGDEKTENISCPRTFEENLADYTGINLAYEAYTKLTSNAEKRLPGLAYSSKQLFWISYALTMCGQYQPENDIDSNRGKFTHLLPHQRIMGSFRNSKYFSEDFNCTAGSSMNPVGKCKIL